MNKTRLKGGSLSGTYLVQPDQCRASHGRASHDQAFIRKEVSLKENREYGFQRWYSQMKRLQRYQDLFPGLFPKLLTCGVEQDLAYFDLEYIESAVTVTDYLQSATSKQVEEVFTAFIPALERMHERPWPSTVERLDLYLREEVEQRLTDASQHLGFKTFLSHKEIILNGEVIPSFASQQSRYFSEFKKSYVDPTESWTHGNVTLENVLYVPSTKQIFFIDPYDENIIDSNLAEYSQVLQSCHAHYELYNNQTSQISGNKVDLRLEAAAGTTKFNDLFQQYLRQKLNENDMISVRMFEVSQFIRMLPFKMVVGEKQMFFFYAWASKLLKDAIQP